MKGKLESLAAQVSRWSEARSDNHTSVGLSLAEIVGQIKDSGNEVGGGTDGCKQVEVELPEHIASGTASTTEQDQVDIGFLTRKYPKRTITKVLYQHESLVPL